MSLKLLGICTDLCGQGGKFGSYHCCLFVFGCTAPLTQINTDPPWIIDLFNNDGGGGDDYCWFIFYLYYFYSVQDSVLLVQNGLKQIEKVYFLGKRIKN